MHRSSHLCMGTQTFKKGQNSAEDISWKMETNIFMFISRKELSPDDVWMEKSIKKQTKTPNQINPRKINKQKTPLKPKHRFYSLISCNQDISKGFPQKTQKEKKDTQYPVLNCRIFTWKSVFLETDHKPQNEPIAQTLKMPLPIGEIQVRVPSTINISAYMQREIATGGEAWSAQVQWGNEAPHPWPESDKPMRFSLNPSQPMYMLSQSGIGLLM